MCFYCMDTFYFLCLDPSSRAKFFLLLRECESLLNGIVHFQKFLTPPFANDLACSGFWVAFLAETFPCPNVHGL